MLSFADGAAATGVSQERFTDATQYIQMERLETTVNTLTQTPTRLTGTEGAAAAADYISSRLEAAGVDWVESQSFQVPRPSVEPFELIWHLDGGSGHAAELHPLWPNGAQLAGVPEEGLTGHLVYGGSGSLSDLAGLELEGSIAAIEFGHGSSWQNAFLLGAAAVVFLEPEQNGVARSAAEEAFLAAPADLPRYWLPAEPAALLRQSLAGGGSTTAEIAGSVSWELAAGDNVIGFIQGSHPELRQEVVVLAAPYDAVSVVPGVAPGAEQALSAAVLLELADFFGRNPPQRSVVLLATAGHGQGLAGIRAFVEHQIRLHGSGPSPQIINAIEADPDYGTDFLGTDIRSVRFVELSLRSDSDRLGLFHQGHFYEERHDFDADSVQFRGDRFAPFARYFESLAAGLLTTQAVGDYLFNGIVPPSGESWSGVLGASRAFEAEAVTLAGGTGITFATVNSRQPLVDTPHDTPDRVQLQNVHVQAELLLRLLDGALNETTGQLPPPLRQDDHFHVVDVHAGGYGTLPDGEMVLVSAHWGQKTVGGVRGGLQQLIHEDGGTVTLAGIPSGYIFQEFELEAALLTQGSGLLTGFLDEGTQARRTFANPARLTQRVSSLTLPLFRGAAVTWVGMPSGIGALLQITDLEARSLSSRSFRQDGSVAVTVTPADGPRFMLWGRGPAGEAFRLSEASGAQPEGEGFASGLPRRVANVPLRAARDMWQLNAWRLNVLAEAGISVPGVVHEHRIAERLLGESEAALGAGNFPAFQQVVMRAMQLSGNLVPRVAGVAEDAAMVLIYYLILAVPFAYFLARVVTTGEAPARRLGLAAGIYLVIFVILYLVHPAFDLGLAIPYDLLAGIGATVAVLVAYFRWGGVVDRWIGSLKGGRRGVERTSPQTVPAIAAAFNIGIENIARRRARSFLTVLTITLLLVAMMSVVAMQPHLEPEGRELEGQPPYEGLFIRGALNDQLSDELLTNLSEWYEGRIQVVPRLGRNVSNNQFWSSPRPYVSFQQRPHRLVGIELEPLGVDPDAMLVLGRWPEPGERALLHPIGSLSTEDAEQILLDTTVDDFFGNEMTIVGIFDHRVWGDLVDIDGYPLAPSQQPLLHAEPNFTASQRTLLARPELVQQYNAGVYGASLFVSDGEDSLALAEELAAVFQRPVSVGIGEASYEIRPATMSASDMLVPFIIMAFIGGLMILNVMIGAVTERTREIKIYGSVGMAPGHVGALLLAEAAVFAVLGVGTGYLFVQLLSKGLALTEILPDVALNIASNEAVTLAGLMIATVLLSTVYPVFMARRVSAPGYEPVWEMGQDVDGTYQGALPFYVRKGQELGINIFLLEFLEEQGEHGTNFFLRGAELFRLAGDQDERGYGLQFTVHLPPFDVGVNQLVRLETIYLGEEQYQIGYQIRHMTGEQNAWRQQNQGFVSKLRRQYLLWNTLDDETRAHYQDKGQERLSEGGGHVVVRPDDDPLPVPEDFNTREALSPLVALRGTYRGGRMDDVDAVTDDYLRSAIAEHFERTQEDPSDAETGS